LKVAPLFEKMRSDRLAWSGHVIEGMKVTTKRVMSMNVDGHHSKSRPRKRWIDCAKDDMKIKRVSMEIANDRREWKKKTCCADPT
jgi:hypothetical protein